MTVEYLDPEPNGLAGMVGGLIQGNLERDPSRLALLRPARIGISASDAEVSISLHLSPGAVRVVGGLTDPLHLRVLADSDVLLELTAVPLRFGMPDVFAADGRAVVGKLLSGRLRVRGLLRHPGKVARLNRLLSVR